LAESDHMVLLGVAHEQRRRQVELAERMLARRVDALLMCPRPADEVGPFVAAVNRDRGQPVVFVDNYVPGCPAARVLTDNRWGARQAVDRLLGEGRRRILFLGGDSAVAALADRYLGYCDALDAAGVARCAKLTVWRDGGDRAVVKTVRQLMRGTDRPDAIFATSFFRFWPFLQLLSDAGLRHPDDILLAGFDRPLENWPADIVRDVLRQPLLVVRQPALELGRAAAETALTAIDGADVADQQQWIRPVLSWQQA
jgi:LacI family transcriptional regulator